MKKKLLATAIAGAMIVPSAFAAQDTSGMQFTSASEGFYASIRVRYSTSTKEEADSVIENSTSRIGIRGSNDLGGGLEGFYRYEFFVPIENGDEGLKTRLSHVGLRGGFGQVWAGTNWAQSYNWVSGSTDIANVGSGNLNYTTLNPGRQSRAIEYTTPDLNGFQASALVSMDDDNDGNDLDLYILGARYGVAGFDVAATYGSRVEGLGDASDAATIRGKTALAFGEAANATALFVADGADGTAGNDDDPVLTTSGDDLTGYSVKVGYSQDNWYVNAWYHEDNASDYKLSYDADGTGAGEAVVFSRQDSKVFSIAGGVEVGKVNVYALHETAEVKGGISEAAANATPGIAEVAAFDGDNTYTTFGVQYNLGSRSRVWIEYINRDLDSATDEDDSVNIGLRHDF